MKKTIVYSFLISFLCFSSQSMLAKNPRNVIFLVGEGMGIAQMYAAMVANGNQLNLERCTSSGFSKTYSANKFTTDSGAAATALACGVKTNNGMIGMSPDSLPAQSILELSNQNKLATGIVVTGAVTHATPASFVAHELSRDMYEEIAADYLKTNIDVFIGGGRKYFVDRNDGRNLINELKAKSYQIAYTLADVKSVKSGKLVGLLYDDQCPQMPERGNLLPEATMSAIDILSTKKKGFFFLVEGSQIDLAAHDNNTSQVVREMLDFDETIGRVLDFAKKDGNTLVIITGDHETGGMTILNGEFGSDHIQSVYATKEHTGVVVPVFAFGPGAENFTGIMENVSFKAKIEKLLKLKKPTRNK